MHRKKISWFIERTKTIKKVIKKKKRIQMRLKKNYFFETGIAIAITITITSKTTPAITKIHMHFLDFF